MGEKLTGRERRMSKDQGKFLEVMDMFTVLVVVMVLWGYTFVSLWEYVKWYTLNYTLIKIFLKWFSKKRNVH